VFNFPSHIDLGSPSLRIGNYGGRTSKIPDKHSNDKSMIHPQRFSGLWNYFSATETPAASAFRFSSSKSVSPKLLQQYNPSRLYPLRDWEAASVKVIWLHRMVHHSRPGSEHQDAQHALITEMWLATVEQAQAYNTISTSSSSKSTAAFELDMDQPELVLWRRR